MTGSPAGASAPPPPPPPEAATVFGARLELAERYAALLCGPGIERGLVGPREVERIWSRHLLNCAVVTELLPPHARVIDVGSGAGLPGVAIAVRRPDVSVVLVEPMARRVEYLREAVAELELDRVTVVMGRVEERATRLLLPQERFVTARAVARLPQLARWCLPLLVDGGQLLALKGRTAQAEVAELPSRGLPVAGVDVVYCGADVLAEATTVVRVTRGEGRWVRA